MTVWLPVIGAVIGLAGIVIGWSLTQLGQWFALRRERKKTMARAIYGMLQIRNRVQIIPDAVRMVGEKLQIPAGGQVVLTAVFENVLGDDGFGGEFEASIAVLADYDPVLAARMRTKNQVVPLFRKLRQMVAANPQAAALWATLEDQIMSHALPQFDAAIIELAALHSRRLKAEVEADLKKTSDVPDEVLAAITGPIQQQMQIEMQIRHAAALAQQQAQETRNTRRVPIWAAEKDKPGNPT